VIITHHMALEDAARGYEIFEKAEEVPQGGADAFGSAKPGACRRRGRANAAALS
jgi:hypothetical protein